MTKVAIPIEKDCLSHQFKDCSYYAVFTIKNSKVVKKETLKPSVKNADEFSDWFASLNITDVVTYQIKNEIIHSFIKKKINVFVGTNKLSPDELIDNYIHGKLTSNGEILSSY